MLEEEAKGFQVVGSKCKEVAARDEERQRPSKKARRKYCRGTVVKMGGSNLCKRCVCWVGLPGVPFKVSN